MCRQEENFDYDGISDSDLEQHKKQVTIDYFFQNQDENDLDIQDFHVAVYCQGQFAIRPYGTSTQVFPYLNDGLQDVTGW